MRTSRNLSESWAKKCQRCCWCVVYMAKAIKVGLIALPRESLGSRVVYEGRKCFVSNWSGSRSSTISDGNGFYLEHADRSKVKNVVNAPELWHRFSSAFSFYSGSWMSIDVNKRLYPPDRGYGLNVEEVADGVSHVTDRE